MDLSIVIPLIDEAESLPELTAWIEKVMNEHHYSYEVVFVDDGSSDNSWEVIEQLQSKNPISKASSSSVIMANQPDLTKHSAPPPVT